MTTDPIPGHEHGSPESYLNGLEVALLAARPPSNLRCPHCRITFRMLPMTGTAWGLEVFHEPGCPDHDDNLPTPERNPR